MVLADATMTNQIYKVTYGKIKDRRMDTVRDLLKAMFDVEQNTCAFDLGNAWATVFANGGSVQFKVITDSEGETITVTCENISSSISNSKQ